MCTTRGWRPAPSARLSANWPAWPRAPWSKSAADLAGSSKRSPNAASATTLSGSTCPYLLERARRRLKHQRIRLVHADGLALPADEGAFDAAISSHYVGHLPPAVRPLAVAELARVVEPGGHVVAVEHRWHPWPECPGLRRIRHIRQSLGFIGLSVFERTDAIVGTPS